MKHPAETKTTVQFDPFSGPQIERVIHTTKAQSEILIDCLFGGDDAKRAYNLSFTLKFSGDLNVDELKHAIESLVERHESLRASFSEDRRFMSIFSEIDFNLSYDDVSNLSGTDQLEIIDAISRENINFLFDLINGPLFKVSLIKTKELEHIFIITVHHSICDGLSIDVFMEELGVLYSAYVQGEVPNLPDPDPFSLFAEKENIYAESVEYQDSEKFWLNIYQDPVPKVELPIDFPRPALRTYNNHRLDFLLDNSLLSALQKTGLSAGSSLVTTLMSAFELLMYKKTGQDNLVIGLTNSRPAHYDMMQLIGHGVNVLPLRSKVDTKISFVDYLKQRKTQLFDAYEHQSISFGHLLEKLSVKRDPSRIPLVPVMLNLELNKNLESEISFFKLSHELHLNIGDYGTFEIELQAFQSKNGPCLRWKYNTTLFKPDTIRQMMSSFEALIEKLVSYPTKPLSEIVDGDNHTLYNTYNSTKAPYPFVALHDLIKIQAEKTPQKLALAFENKEFNYAEIQSQANQIAHYLSEHGVLPGDFIAVSLPRCPELVTVLLAIMQTGAAYIPLDPSYPKARLEFMLKDSDAKYLITSKEVTSLLEVGSKVFLSEDILAGLSRYPSSPLPVSVDINKIAYIIYTSGSTGKPKGVMVTHKNLVNFLQSMRDKPGIKETDKLLSITTISFDIAGLELYLPLLEGATLVIANDETSKDSRLMLDVLKDQSITMMQATPTTWQMLLDSGWEQPLPIKALCGGEALPIELAKKILARVDELWNMYGPTETTIWSSTKQILKTDEVITIGRPIANTQIYMIDEQKRLVDAGKIGELCIAGDGVAKGYWKRQDLTDEKFIDNPFESELGPVLYRTGDLAKLLPSGEVQCLGRIDQQIKIRGHRIELGEIEQALDSLDGVHSSVVVVNNDILVANLIPSVIGSQNSAQMSTWKEVLKNQLPAHMVPQQFNLLRSFPTTLNGKIDRKTLADSLSVNNKKTNFNAAETKSEKIIAKIWQECLEIEKVDIHSDFFELGGHSLMAVKVMSLIEKQTGNRLPLASLIEQPTVKKLAAYMDKRFISWDCLVPLNPKGTKTPIFIVHGANHNILVYKNLAEELDDDQPVYALQAKGLSGEVEPHNSVEEMASHYISEIKTVTPDGPYALAGFSFGGIIAFEMAKQLRAEGKEVKILALFDSYVYPHYYYTNPFVKKLISSLYTISQLFFMGFNMFSSVKNFNRRYNLLKLKFEGWYLKIRYGSEKQKQMQFNRSSKIDQMHAFAFKRYNLIPQDITVDLFRATNDIYFAHDYNLLGWKKIAKGGIRKHILPGNHSEMFLPPIVEQFGSKLQFVLDNYDSENKE